MGLSAPQIDVHVGDGIQRTLHDDVLDGLTRPSKELPPKHLYDAYGSELFDRITELPEYYPTRAEREILTGRAAEIVSATRMGELVELGSGTATKTRVLLDAATEAGTLRRYVPFDVAEVVVRDSVAALAEAYPGVELHGIVGDFERHLGEIPEPEPGCPRVLAFLGGTIGNFLPGSRRRFLRELASRLGPDDRLLLGTDLVKDPDVLEAAYDDAAGVTAAFNLNVLARINRELGGDFVLSQYRHVARWDARERRIEMHLCALTTRTVHIADAGFSVRIEQGETIWTESSHKYRASEVGEIGARLGMRVEGQWIDVEWPFAHTMLRAE